VIKFALCYKCFGHLGKSTREIIELLKGRNPPSQLI